ncbi:MAG: DUF6958 family protein [Phreatobacter sp.]
MATSRDDKIEVENIKQPAGRVTRVDKSKYDAMKQAFLAVLPNDAPGLTVPQIKEKLLPHLPQDLFPGGAKAGWWIKAVQLDLEAKGIVQRAATPPVRLRKL